MQESIKHNEARKSQKGAAGRAFNVEVVRAFSRGAAFQAGRQLFAEVFEVLLDPPA